MKTVTLTECSGRHFFVELWGFGELHDRILQGHRRSVLQGFLTAGQFTEQYLFCLHPFKFM